MSDSGTRLAGAFGRLFAAVGYLLFWVSIGLEWPLGRVGNAFQLLGVFITLLGVAVVPGWLDTAEQWIAGLGARIKDRWTQLRTAGQAVSFEGLFAGLTLQASAGVGNLLEVLNEEIHAVADRLDELEREGSAARSELEEQLRKQDAELRAHVIAVTRQGWQFIVWGLLCSGFGVVLALAA